MSAGPALWIAGSLQKKGAAANLTSRALFLCPPAQLVAERTDRSLQLGIHSPELTCKR